MEERLVFLTVARANPFCQFVHILDLFLVRIVDGTSYVGLGEDLRKKYVKSLMEFSRQVSRIYFLAYWICSYC